MHNFVYVIKAKTISISIIIRNVVLQCIRMNSNLLVLFIHVAAHL